MIRNRFISGLGVGNPQPTQGNQFGDTPLVAQLKAQLANAQQMQAQLTNMQAGYNPYFPQPQAYPQNQQPVQPIGQQPIQGQQVQPSPEVQTLMALFNEFAETEDGKQLVAFIGKFNGFCQSKIQKAQNQANGHPVGQQMNQGG